MKKRSLKIGTATLLCVGAMFFAGCGVKDDVVKGSETAGEIQEEQILEENKAENSDEADAHVLKEEDVVDDTDVENEVDSDKKNAEKAQELYEAQIRHYYSGVLSQIIGVRQLPDGELDTSSLDAGFGEMRDNHFAVTDIDGDGREELIVCYANAIMAGMMEIIYDYDPVLGKLKREFTQFPALTYYDNGIIKAEASHNHSRGEFWPITLFRYEPKRDSYEQIGYACAWDKAISDSYEGQPFPDELDVDGDGTIYCIQTDTSVKDAFEWYEDYKYDQADFEEWYNGLMKGAEEISIEYQPMEYESFAAFTPAYLKLLADEAGKERLDTDSDLGLLILNEDYYLDAAKTLLSEKYNVELDQPEPDFEEYTVGTISGREIFTFTALDSGDLSYSGEKVGDVTIFGIYPGISENGAWEKLKAYGFYASPYGEVENCLITGEGFGNVSIWFSAEDGIVTDITVRPFCAFAG
ncbi:MAG: hypothetical protein K2M22_07620 [Lachnospiraceae bacterium]|nr:hypothetical protein [Lachnospiraceae bacterium]MDE7176740.1 hypothetical protein [Lachnospiraceae bacterium]